MRILITGGSGAMGSSLRKKLPDAFSPSHKEMDVTSGKSVETAILDYKPDAVIHTAALVGIRECEEDKEKAWKTNVEGTQHIVSAIKKLASPCYLIYISTACVFGGEDRKFYTEEDTPSPKNFYSLTKLCGEMIVRQHAPTCIIRTNFAPKEQWKYPKAFTDRHGTYLFADGVAQGIIDVMAKRPEGIIHIVGDKRVSMYDLALLAGSAQVGKMTLDEYEGPPLTVDMSLSTTRWKKYKLE